MAENVLVSGHISNYERVQRILLIPNTVFTVEIWTTSKKFTMFSYYIYPVLLLAAWLLGVLSIKV